MSLTFANEQKLRSVGLVAFFDSNRAVWQLNVQDCYNHLKPRFTVVRPDDVKKVLYINVEVYPALKAFLASKKLTQKYWFDYFTDLAIERT